MAPGGRSTTRSLALPRHGDGRRRRRAAPGRDRLHDPAAGLHHLRPGHQRGVRGPAGGDRRLPAARRGLAVVGGAHRGEAVVSPPTGARVASIQGALFYALRRWQESPANAGLLLQDVFVRLPGQVPSIRRNGGGARGRPHAESSRSTSSRDCLVTRYRMRGGGRGGIGVRARVPVEHRRSRARCRGARRGLCRPRRRA